MSLTGKPNAKKSAPTKKRRVKSRPVTFGVWVRNGITLYKGRERVWFVKHNEDGTREDRYEIARHTIDAQRRRVEVTT